MTHKALLWEAAGEDRVRCGLCPHRCVIADGAFGFCGVRKNTGGELFTFAYGRVIASHVDPIEKKPLYHFMPGTKAYSLAAAGCNFKCSFCQNWTISQISVSGEEIDGYDLAPEEAVREAVGHRCNSIAYTYTEPTIFMEYAREISKLGRKKDLASVFITNGYITAEAVDLIEPYLDAVNVDLKFFSDDSYVSICGGHLQPVLDSIKKLKDAGVWVEVTTLLMPGVNDSDRELSEIAGFIASTGRDIPWHVNRFHPDYKYMDSEATPPETLERAEKIGRGAGLKYVYQGNVFSCGETACPGCGEVLIRREGFSAQISKQFDETAGKCLKCGEIVEGVWQ